MIKRKKILLVMLVVLILLSNFSNIFAKGISSGDKVNLKFDHECISVLKYIGEDRMKQVIYVCYQDPETKIKYPAFCVEPANAGIGTGAGNSYDVKLSDLNSPILWRMLYKGYVGTSYKTWNLECDDDLYFATKTAVHCYAEGSTPKTKYEIPTRVGIGDNAKLEDVQRRGKKVLDVAQKIYDYGINGNENFAKATCSIINGSSSEQTINNIKYLVQNYLVKSNKDLSSYTVSISKFPLGTKILNSSNKETTNMVNASFKIAIPIKKLTENFTGEININNAEIKSYPIFYAASGNTATQDYVISGKTEMTKASTKLSVDVYKSSLKIVKKDDEKKPVKGAVFNLKYADGENIGDYTTNANGEITVNKLKQGKIIVTEKSTPNPYVLDKKSKNVILEYNSGASLNVTNDLKRGSLEVIKVDEDYNEIELENVEFEIIDSNGNVVEILKTDKEGKAKTKKLPIGEYRIHEISTNENYVLNSQNTVVTIEKDKVASVTITNAHKKGDAIIYKVDKDNNKIGIPGVKFDLYSEEFQKVVGTYVSDKNGEIHIKNLRIGEYKLIEKKASEGYNLIDDSTIKIEWDLTTSTMIENEKQKGQIKIIKTSESDNLINGKPKGSPIEGVIFEIKNESGEIVQEIVTNKEGIAISKKLEIGKYTVKETKTDKFYELLDEEFTIEITENNQIEELEIANKSKQPEPEPEPEPEVEVPKLPRTGF